MIKEIEKAGSCLIMAHGGKLKEVVREVMNYLIKADYSGIYISVNVPHQTVDNLLKRDGLDTEKVLYIDCITATTHRIPHKEGKNVIYAEHPSELRDGGRIMSEITQYLLSVPGKKFVVIDTLRTMLLYNEPKIVSGFTDLLIAKVTESKSKLIVFTREEHDEELIKEISHRFDQVLEV